MSRRDPKPGSKRAQALRRQLDLKALKEQYGYTWSRIAAITQYSLSTLKQYSCGAKPVTSRALALITLKLAEHARTSAPRDFNEDSVPF